MLYDANAVIDALRPLVGWVNEAGEPDLPPGLLAGLGRVCFNRLHPQITLRTLRRLAPEALADDDAQFGLWLQECTDMAVVRLVDRWLEEKQLLGTANTVVGNTRVFGQVGTALLPAAELLHIGQTYGRSGQGHGLRLRIETIALCLEQAQAVEVFLLGGNDEEIGRATYDYTQPRAVQQFKAADLALAYDFAAGPLRICIDPRAVQGGYYQIAVMRPPRFCTLAHQRYREDHYLANTGTRASGGYGVVAAGTLTCDFTSFLIENAALFRSAWCKQVVHDLLHLIALNPNDRLNRTEGNLNVDRLMYEREGDTRGRKTGSGAELDRAIRAISLDRSALDPLIFPKRKSRKIKVGSV